jgi:hypothetical protein
MGNRRICVQNAQISDAQKDVFETSKIPKSIYKDDIYHGAIDLSLVKGEYDFKLFENAVDDYPARPAVIFQNKEYSYEEIDSNATRLAWYLRERGTQTVDKVDLIQEKSAELYIAMPGIMKSSAAYLPIDAGYPHCQPLGVSCSGTFSGYFFHVFVLKRAIIGGYKSGTYLLDSPLEQKLS